MTAFIAAILALFWAQLPGGVVTGQLLSRDGAPAVGVRVGAMPVGEAGIEQPLTSMVMTDELGRYRMTLPAGRYYIQAGRVSGPTYHPGTTTLTTAGIVSVVAGSEVRALDFSLVNPWEVKVSGRVIGASPEEFAGAEVQLLSFPGAPSWSISAPVLSDGRFEFPHVMPGAVYLAAIQTPNPKSVAVTAVVVDAGDVSGVTLPLLRPLEVHGDVIVEGGGVVPAGMQIDSTRAPHFAGDENRIVADSMQRNAVGRRNIRLGGESTFFLQLAEGDRKISVSRLPETFSVKSIHYGATDLTRETLKLSGAQTVEKIRVTIAPK